MCGPLTEKVEPALEYKNVEKAWQHPDIWRNPTLYIKECDNKEK